MTATRTRPLALDGHSVEAEPAQDHISEVQVVVLDILRVAGPCTHDVLVALYEARVENYPGVPAASPQSIRSRTAELVRRGLVAASPVPGLSKYGRPATQWVLAKQKAAA